MKTNTPNNSNSIVIATVHSTKKTVPKSTALSSSFPEKRPAPAAKQVQLESTHREGVLDASVKINPTQLTHSEQKALDECVNTILKSQVEAAGNFQKRATAFYRIQRDKLYRGEHATEEAFFKANFGISRSHSLRLAQMGGVIERLSPAGDNLLASDAHLRPVLKLSHKQQDAIVTKAQSWAKLANLVSIPARLIAAAATFLNPPTEPREPKDSAQSKLAAKFHEAVTNAQSSLPATVDKVVTKAFESLLKTVKKIAGAVSRYIGIAWTQETWNPLHGCTRASAGCDNCYAAKFTATRAADVYPGLAVKKVSAAGTITYAFTGKIQLAPERLAEPLLDHVPKRIFVNSMSDLFHKDVPEEFINDVFTVMELAHWHIFQVLTKRPQRMAVYTQKRYADKNPPKNIWLGTSTENQAAYDERIAHLRQTKAAVRWLSAEPLIGSIQFGSMDGIDWVVVGGESGANARPMAKIWATEIRDACKNACVPFFFKQWGAYNEVGKKEREKSETPELEGVVHQEYPTQ